MLLSKRSIRTGKATNIQTLHWLWTQIQNKAKSPLRWPRLTSPTIFHNLMKTFWHQVNLTPRNMRIKEILLIGQSLSVLLIDTSQLSIHKELISTSAKSSSFKMDSWMNLKNMNNFNLNKVLLPSKILILTLKLIT